MSWLHLLFDQSNESLSSVPVCRPMWCSPSEDTLTYHLLNIWLTPHWLHSVHNHHIYISKASSQDFSPFQCQRILMTTYHCHIHSRNNYAIMKTFTNVHFCYFSEASISGWWGCWRACPYLNSISHNITYFYDISYILSNRNHWFKILGTVICLLEVAPQSPETSVICI